MCYKIITYLVLQLIPVVCGVSEVKRGEREMDFSKE